MGYGGFLKGAGEVTSKSSDEGINRLIKENKLGPDIIYIQAKRWKNSVGRPEIQSFVSSLVGKQSSKRCFYHNLCIYEPVKIPFFSDFNTNNNSCKQ
jgi:restriction system protein